MARNGSIRDDEFRDCYGDVKQAAEPYEDEIACGALIAEVCRRLFSPAHLRAERHEWAIGALKSRIAQQMTSRRSFLFGAAALIAAPAVVRSDSLMKLWVPKPRTITLAEWAKIAEDSMEKMIRPPLQAAMIDAMTSGIGVLDLRPSSITYIDSRAYQPVMVNYFGWFRTERA